MKGPEVFLEKNRGAKKTFSEKEKEGLKVFLEKMEGLVLF